MTFTLAVIGGPAHGQTSTQPKDLDAAGSRTDIGTVRATGDDPANGSAAVTDVRPSATGSREQARAVKRLAPNLIEVQPRSEIRKLPDASVAEALSRVSGVSLETDTAEGRYITLRGLEANLNAVTFGGIKLVPTNPASPFGGGRAVPLDTFPTSMIGGLQLTKSLRPDQDAEGLGGQIDILPRLVPLDGKTHVEANLLAGVEPLRGTPVIGGDLTISSNFGYMPGTRPWDTSGAPVTPSGDFFTNPHPFSVMFTESHFNDRRGIDDFETSYNDTPGAPNALLSSLELRRYQYNRQRYGRGGELSFQPNDQDRWYFRYFESGYDDRSLRHRLTLNGLDSALPCTPLPGCAAGLGGVGFIAPRARAIQELRDVNEQLRTQIISFGGENLLANRVKVDYHGAFVQGTYTKPYDYIATFANPTAFPLAYDNTSDPAHPGFRTLNGVNLADPARYGLSGIAASQQQVRDREWSGAVNAATPLDILALNGVIKAGASARLRHRTLSAPQQTYAASSALPYAAFTSGDNEVFYDNRYNIGPTPSAGVANLIGTSALTRSNLLRDGTRTAAAQQNNFENIYAWYGQYQATVGQLDVLTGVRFEKTDGTYNANTVVTRGATFTATPSVNHQDYLNVFPTLQASYRIEPTLVARAAYSTAIGRPGFNQITAATIVDVGAGTVTVGNPNLKPTTANGFDISVEKYLPSGGIVSLGAFGKAFQNYILPTTTTGTFPGITGPARLNSFSNGGDAHAYGIEAAYVQKFDFLPAALSGFGIDANYSYVQSGVKLHPGQGDEPLPGTADHNANIGLFYEDGPIGFRLAGAFASRSLFRVGTSRDLDQFATPRFRLDASARYKLNEHLEWFAYGRNLTDAALEYTEGASGTRYVQREFYGMTLYSGLRVTY